MSNGTITLVSLEAKALWDKICANAPQLKHYTVNTRYMAAVVGKPMNTILLYDFERSIKPLLRLTDRGSTCIIRDYYKIEDGLKILTQLEAITACNAPWEKMNEHTHSHSRVEPAGICHEDYKGTDAQAGPGILGQNAPICHWGEQLVQNEDSVLDGFITHGIAVDLNKRVHQGIKLAMVTTRNPKICDPHRK